MGPTPPRRRAVDVTARIADKAAFGERLRQLRRRAAMTLQEFSMRTGLATSTLSKIENGQISPTYDSIQRLADGLEIDVTELFLSRQTPLITGRRSVTKSGAGTRHETANYCYEMLSADLTKKKMIPLITTLKAQSITEFGPLIRHDGEEFVHVLCGTIEIHTDVYEPLRLGVGDSCYFDSSMSHGLIACGPEVARVLWVCTASMGLSQTPGQFFDSEPSDRSEDAVEKPR